MKNHSTSFGPDAFGARACSLNGLDLAGGDARQKTQLLGRLRKESAHVLVERNGKHRTACGRALPVQLVLIGNDGPSCRSCRRTRGVLELANSRRQEIVSTGGSGRRP